MTESADCPVCHPPLPVMFTASRDVVTQLYVDLMREAAKLGPALGCYEDPDRWYLKETAGQARRICKGKEDGYRVCPILDLCATAGLLGREEFGVWGGMTPQDRQYIMRKAFAR